MRKLFFTIVLMLCTFLTYAQTTQWIGPAGGDWSTAANWTNGIPASGNDALITGGSDIAINNPLIIDYSVTNFSGNIAVNADVFNIGNFVNSGGNMSLSNGALFLNSGSVSFTNDGPFTNDGTFLNYGTFQQNGNGVFNNNPTGQFINYGNITNVGNFNNNGTVENFGTLTNASTFVNNALTRNCGSFINTFVSTLDNNANATFHNKAGAQLFIDKDFNNAGTLDDDGSTTLNASGVVNNTGTININGLFQVSTVFNNDGIVNVDGSYKSNFGTTNNNSTWNNTGRTENLGTFNNNAGSILTNTGSLINASCANFFQRSNRTINSMTNDGVLYQLGGAVDVTGASQGVALRNANTQPTPVLICRDIQIQTDENGEVNITAGDVLVDGDAKYCNIVTLEVTQTDFTCADLGVNPVTVTLTDGFNNSNTCTVNVTVVETSPNPCNTSFLNYCNATSNRTTNEFIQSVSLADLTNTSSNSLASDFTNQVAMLEFGDFYDLEVITGSANGKVTTAAYIDWNNDGDFNDADEEVLYSEDGPTTVSSVINVPGTALPGKTRMRVIMSRGGTVNACSNLNFGEVEDYTIMIASDIIIQNCVGDIVVSAAPGATEQVVGWIPPKGFSTCQNGIEIEFVSGLDNGSSFPLGETVNTLRFVDGCGNEQECSFTVTVNPTPVTFNLSCIDDVILEASAGLGGAIANWLAPFPSATCPQGVNLPVQTVGPTPGEFLPTGTRVTVCYEATDNCGNTDNCCFEVFVTDPAETLTFDNCPSVITVDGTPGAAGTVVTYPTFTATSSCAAGGLNIVLQGGLPSGSIFPNGNTTVTYRATDDCISAALCSFIVTVNPTPSEVTVNCPDDIIVDVNPGAPSQVVNYPAVTATSDCPGAIQITQTQGLPSGNAFPLGNTVVQYMVNDACGDMENCTFNVTLNTVAASTTINCPNDITVNAAAGNVGVNVNWATPTATSNCFTGNVSVKLVSALSSGNQFPLGTQEVIYFASDDCGTSGSCSFFVTVEPTPANLSLNCGNDVIRSMGIGFADPTAFWTTPTASSTCGGTVNVTQIAGPPNGSQFAAGSTTITYRATDGCGNIEICSFDVIVNVNSPSSDPEITINCNQDITVTAAPGQTGASVGFNIPTATTSCNGGSTGGTNQFDCSAAPVPGNNTVDCCSFISNSIPGYLYLGTFNGSKYYCSSTNNFTWTQARDAAIRNGGTLAIINSSSENEFLRSHLATSEAWIGYNDSAIEGQFRWDGGFSNYTNWLAGEPNDQDPTYGNGTGDYTVLVGSDGLWRDRDGRNLYEYVMEIPCGCAAPSFQLLGEYNGSKYYRSSTYASWEGANAIAKANNTNLVTIDNAGENAYITSLISENIWLGLNDRAVEGNFRWTDGSAVGYTNWVFGQPDDRQAVGGEDFAYISSDGRWRDGGTSRRFRYIVEVKCPQVSCTATGISGYTLIGNFGQNAYYVANTPTTWESAKSSAIAAGGHLATVSSQAENDFIVNNATASSGSFWIGLDNVQNSGLFQFVTSTFKWVTGELLIYTNWATAEPNGFANPVAARIIDGTGKWVDSSVGSRFNAVIEVPCTSTPTTGGSSEAIVTQVEGLAPNTIFPIGTTTIVYEVNDDCGNFAYCEFDVIVNQSSSAIALSNCPADITITAAAGATSARVNFSAPTATSDCTQGNVVVSQTGGFASGQSFPVGQTTVSYRAVDGCGNEQFCSFFVIVTATPPPATEITVNCPANIQIDAAVGAISASTTFATPTATTTCNGNVNITQIGGLPSGSDFPIGQTVIFYRLADECGNFESCAFNVVVNSTPASISINCPANVSVNATPDAEYATATFGNATATSDCFTGTETITQIGGLPSGSLFPVGNSVVFFKATDACGNFAVCNFLITVNATPITNLSECVNAGGDADGDGVCADIDCDDNNPLVSQAGDSCNDGNPATSNDVIQADCSCAGVIVFDCPALSANIGDACNDGNANTSNDTVQADCSCAGSVNPPTFDCPALSANIGDACNDGNANTSNDTVQADCSCAGTVIPPTFDCPALSANIGDACNDGNANTSNDTVQADCSCAGTVNPPTFDCPALSANIGDACNDGNANTTGDSVQADCSCAGTPVQTGCTATYTLNGLDIDFSNVDAPISTVKVFDNSFATIFACDNFGGTACANNFTVTVPSTGTYFIQIQTYQDWATNLCDVFETVEIGGTTPTFDCPALSANIGDACNDGNPTTTNDMIQADCSCLGTTPQCLANGGTLTGGPFNFCVDGTPDNIPANGLSLTGVSGTNTGWIVIDGRGTIVDLPSTITTTNFDAAGVGTCFIYHIAYENDLTGLAVGNNLGILNGCFDLSDRIDVIREICDTDDCPALGANIGDACNDGNANTTGDTVQADCSCAGTPVQTGCTATYVVNGLSIDFSSVDAPISTVKVFDGGFATIFACDNFGGTACADNFSVNLPSAGTYFIQIQTYQDWANQLCNVFDEITASGSGNGGGTCDNVTSGGTISGEQTICPNADAAPITSTTLPSGGSGTMEYLWLSSTTGCPVSLNDQIAGANQSTYDPGQLTQTTYFRRCARRAGCTDWFAGESNCVVITIDDTNCEPTTGSCNATYTVSGMDITLNNIAANIAASAIFDNSFTPIFQCNNFGGTACNNTETVTVPAPGTYFVQIQTYTDWSNQVCNIFEEVTVTGNATRQGNDANTQITAPNSIDTDKEESITDFKVFPNPAMGSVNVALEDFQDRNIEIRLISQLGKTLKTITLQSVNTKQHEVNLAGITNGIYTIIILEEGQAPTSKKLVVRRGY